MVTNQKESYQVSSSTESLDLWFLSSSTTSLSRCITPSRNQLATSQHMMQLRRDLLSSHRWLHFIYEDLIKHVNTRPADVTAPVQSGDFFFVFFLMTSASSLLVNKTQTDPRRLSMLDIYFVVSINVSSLSVASLKIIHFFLFRFDYQQGCRWSLQTNCVLSMKYLARCAF